MSRLGGSSTAAAVSDRALDRYALAHDASHYLLIPQAVARPTGAGMVGELIRAAQAAGMPVTLRGGGTSLSGQSVGSGLLVDVRRHFRDVTVLDEGRRVRAQPGATVRALNTRLAPFGRRFGPDPASESACTIGGVVANNSSGMQCGTEYNSYRTLESLVMVLPSGTTIDSGAAEAAQVLSVLEPALHEGLIRLRRRILDRPDSVATIRRLFALKNTMGYGLNAFLDYEDPLDILSHLMVGSEGTLGFVAEATFSTVEVLPCVATALVVFDDLTSASAAIPALVEGTRAATAELLDAASLRVAQSDAACPPAIAALGLERQAAILIELQAGDDVTLQDMVRAAEPVLTGLEGVRPAISEAVFSTDPGVRAALWSTRKGLYSAVAGARERGTSALLEDVAVPVARLGEMCTELTGLMAGHGYEGSVIFGHARDGNLHFMLQERFDSVDCMTRYESFTEEMVDLVLGLGGTLKAEHGTGRIMAPFVARQYGDELHDVMRSLKDLLDPSGLLGHGSVLTDDRRAYLRDLKTTPPVEEEVDRCVECGFCEPVCPSKDLTLTPRQRIVLRRERAAASADGRRDLVAEFDRDYGYAGVETCAADGMCATACPVHIDTGDLVRRLRRDAVPGAVDRAGKAAADHWGLVTRSGGAGLDVAARLPGLLPVGLTRAGRRLLGADVVPRYDPRLPSGGDRRRPVEHPDPVAVLFPACIGTVFGGSDSIGALDRLCSRAGVGLRTPADIAGLCCGTPWKSKGLARGYRAMSRKTVVSLSRATEGSRLPVVTDASSCTEGLRNTLSDSGIEVVDAVTLVRSFADRLDVRRPVDHVVVHPTCSGTVLGNTPDLLHLAALACGSADRVHVPARWGCCGFAGDRGLLHPELTASATRPETEDVESLALGLSGSQVAYVSSNRTCEIGMDRATGRSYRHVLDLLDEVTAPLEPPAEERAPSRPPA